MKIKKHKASSILFAIAIIISLLIYTLLFYFCIIGVKNIILREKVFELFSEEAWAFDIIKYFGGFAAIIILIMLLITVFISLHSFGITALAYDVPVTENQFKELLDFEIECAKKLGLKEIPKIYIDTYSYGEEEVIKIKGARFDNKHILRIDAQDIFNSAEAGYYLAKFTIAKKLVSIYLGYQEAYLLILILCSKWVPIFSNLCNRVMCYNCDNGAVALLGTDMAIKAISTKSTGFYLSSYMNMDDYILNLENVINERDVIFENLLLDVPLPAYRLQAIIYDKDGRLF